ncbi:MAG: Pyruvate carboxyltransferase protein [Thermoproteota archaeon]|nr:Pyruvate carboxyltransferase protein [Thermoproteota archaeon]
MSSSIPFYNRLGLKVNPIIDDCTLRDGVQMPGTAVSPRHATHIAYLLDAIGVERIELHHYQQPDKEAIKLIKDLGLKARLTAWCRAVREDIDSALKLDFKEVGISHPVSDIHFKAKWPDTTPDELLRRVVDTVEYAKDHGLIVFVHGEDSTRADWNFERKFINSVAEAGAEVYRICDTVGLGSSDTQAPVPTGIPQKIRKIKEETKMKGVEIHAHDDLGNAVENSIATVRAAEGVFDDIYVSTTMLGMGERSGNAETEKIMMNLYVHYGFEKYENGLYWLKEVADYISYATGVIIPPNKAIVGDNAFTHESGIHTHGVLRNPETYEPFPPKLVGNVRKLTIGKQSGSAIVKHMAEQMVGKNIEKNDPRLESLVKLIKAVYVSGERKSSLKDDEFKELVKKSGLVK